MCNNNNFNNDVTFVVKFDITNDEYIDATFDSLKYLIGSVTNDRGRKILESISDERFIKAIKEYYNCDTYKNELSEIIQKSNDVVYYSALKNDPSYMYLALETLFANYKSILDNVEIMDVFKEYYALLLKERQKSISFTDYIQRSISLIFNSESGREILLAMNTAIDIILGDCPDSYIPSTEDLCEIFEMAAHPFDYCYTELDIDLTERAIKDAKESFRMEAEKLDEAIAAIA